MGVISLPCFAVETPSHEIRIHIPKLVYYKESGTQQMGTANNNWYVEYETYVYEGFAFEDVDTEYQITISQHNLFDYQGQSYESDTVVTVWVVDAPTETKEEYIYYSNRSVERVTGVQLRENGHVYPLDELYNYVDREGTTESAYEWSYRIRVEKGKSTYYDLYLYVPARHYNYAETEKSDEELIDDLLEQVGGIDEIDYSDINATDFKDVTDMLFDMWYIELICVAVISISAIGYVLYGKR